MLLSVIEGANQQQQQKTTAATSVVFREQIDSPAEKRQKLSDHQGKNPAVIFSSIIQEVP